MWKHSGAALCFSHQTGSITVCFDGWLKDFQRDVLMRNETRLYGCVPLSGCLGETVSDKTSQLSHKSQEKQWCLRYFVFVLSCSRQHTLECQTSEIPVSTWTRHNTTDHVTSLRWHLPKTGWYIFKQQQGTFNWLWNSFNLILMLLYDLYKQRRRSLTFSF